VDEHDRLAFALIEKRDLDPIVLEMSVGIHDGGTKKPSRGQLAAGDAHLERTPERQHLGRPGARRQLRRRIGDRRLLERRRGRSPPCFFPLALLALARKVPLAAGSVLGGPLGHALERAA
jgi:hypothetical protein